MGILWGAVAMGMFSSFCIILHTQTWDTEKLNVWKGHDSFDSAVISLHLTVTKLLTEPLAIP